MQVLFKRKVDKFHLHNGNKETGCGEGFSMNTTGVMLSMYDSLLDMNTTGVMLSMYDSLLDKEAN